MLLVLSEHFLMEFLNFFYQSYFSDLPLLTFMDLSNNLLPEILEKHFLKLLNLQTLYLHHNRIEKIANKAFESLLQLRVLDISRNKLKTFTLEMFGGISKFTGNKLRKLNLSNNRLMVLDTSLFANLKNLVYLNLAFVSNKFCNFFLISNNFFRMNSEK